MKHSNISVFVPHIGCPNMCSFCNQHTISGAQSAPTVDEVKAVCEKALGEVGSPENSEIAFFGGSFTAIPRSYMTGLLQGVQEFIGDKKFRGIRISTRPDCIDSEVLELLKRYHVTSIELGAQSMSDAVLASNDRGHTSADVVNASRLIRENGFELGLQMMIGLYGSSEKDELETAEKIISIRPDTMRIYPVVILRGTRLVELYESGIYKPFSFDTAVELAAEVMIRAEKSGIRVIKCGLHASEFVEQDAVGGFYHPAFRELCENQIYRKKIAELIGGKCGKYVISVAPDCISKAVGQRKSNIDYFNKIGISIKIIGVENMDKYQCELRSE